MSVSRSFNAVAVQDRARSFLPLSDAWPLDLKELHAVLAYIIAQAAQDGSLLLDDPTVAAEQFLALVRGELHLHCLYDPSFRPSRFKIQRQIGAGIDCLMARCGVSTSSAV